MDIKLVDNKVQSHVMLVSIYYLHHLRVHSILKGVDIVSTLKIITTYGLRVYPHISDPTESTDPDFIIGWSVFSELLHGYWGNGETLKKAILNWARINKVSLPRRKYHAMPTSYTQRY